MMNLFSIALINVQRTSSIVSVGLESSAHYDS